MKKLLYIGLIGLMAGCGDGKPRQPERLPDDEVPAFREACIKMAHHIVLKDSAYRLTIPKDSAMRLGIPGRYYDRMQQELEYTNYIVKEEYNKKGIPIEMPEYTIDTINRIDTIDTTNTTNTTN